jgi:polyisoprenoid-binding protein YceI
MKNHCAVAALARSVVVLGVLACSPAEELPQVAEAAPSAVPAVVAAPVAAAVSAPAPQDPVRTATPAPTKTATQTAAKASPVPTARAVSDTAASSPPSPPVVTPVPTAAITPPTPAAAPAPAPVASLGELALQPGSRLWFDGTSNVKDFTCKSSTLSATVVTSGANAAPAVLAGTKSVTSVAFSVPVTSLDCDNGTMNGHMRKALEMEKHPQIAFALESYELVPAAAGTAVTLVGSLTIRGAPRPVTMLAQVTPGDAGGMRLVGSYELNMKDFGVKPPSLMLNTMKVREKVKVGFDLVLKD